MTRLPTQSHNATKLSCRKRETTVKFAADTTCATAHKVTACDRCLQSTGNKRRYMRRGSKSASMIIRAMQKEIVSNQRVLVSPEPPLKEIGSDGQVRRLSLMSALKVSLDQVTIDDQTSDEESKDDGISSSDIRRRTIQVLAEVTDM
ncbi:hypothetical protein MPSEU_000439800 [Mayamaea pseudoterrestris]|nr:hypothetical protein MPSEU_000439800 [Mayamaea pseudoterrestris]